MKNKILVADDDSVIRKIVTRAIESDSCAIIPAANGKDALMLVKQKKPDLVILDIYMPGKTGWEVLKELRRDAQMRLTPVIMITGLGGTAEDEARGLNAGADDYIAKPFLPLELRIKVHRLLQRCRMNIPVNRLKPKLSGL